MAPCQYQKVRAAMLFVHVSSCSHSVNLWLRAIKRHLRALSGSRTHGLLGKLSFRAMVAGHWQWLFARVTLQIADFVMCHLQNEQTALDIAIEKEHTEATHSTNLINLTMLLN